MTWTISFYNERVRQDVPLLPDSIAASLRRTLDRIAEWGPALGKPHTTSMGNGLFEIRARGQEGIARALFCTLSNREIVILVVFVKKTQKTPDDILKLARKRMKEVKTSD